MCAVILQARHVWNLHPRSIDISLKMANRASLNTSNPAIKRILSEVKKMVSCVFLCLSLSPRNPPSLFPVCPSHPHQLSFLGGLPLGLSWVCDVVLGRKVIAYNYPSAGTRPFSRF